MLLIITDFISVNSFSKQSYRVINIKKHYINFKIESPILSKTSKLSLTLLVIGVKAFK